jgi:hypothetical protein
MRTSLIVDIQAARGDIAGAETRAARAASAIADAVDVGANVLVAPHPQRRTPSSPRGCMALAANPGCPCSRMSEPTTEHNYG